MKLGAFNQVLSTVVTKQGIEAVKSLICDINQEENANFYLLSDDKQIISCANVPEGIRQSVDAIQQYQDDAYIYRINDYLVCRPIPKVGKPGYWLILDGEPGVLLHKSYLFYILRGVIAAFIALSILALVLYLLSSPLNRVSEAVSRIRKGDFSLGLEDTQGVQLAEISDL